jgi:predicted SprT family Zn-dependent metalloprotease
MTTIKRNDLIEQTIQETLHKIQCPIKNINYSWNMQKKSIARALGYNQLSFSKIWWKYLTDEQRKEVVIHEVCHLGDYYLNITDKSWKSTLGHGPRWKELMVRAGAKYIEAEWNQVMPEEFRNILNPYKLECDCRVYKVSKKEYMVFLNNPDFTLRCTKCNKNLAVVPIKN